MKAILLLISALWAPCLAAAEECTGAENLLQSVSSALASEALDKAEHILDSLEHSYPNCSETLLDRARLLAVKGNATAAEEAFVRYQKLAPDASRGYAYFGRFLLEQRQYARADSASLVALEKNPSEPAVLALRGEILIMKGLAEEGASLLQHALQIDPDNVDANFQLGTLYDKENRHADAVKHFERVVVIDPNDPRAWDYLALNTEIVGEVDRAGEAYRNAEAVNRRGRHFDGFLDYNYGRFLLKGNQLTKAKEHLDRAVELTPNVRAVWYERAKVNLSMKKYEDASADGERAATVRDTGGVILDLQIYALLEQIYGRLGNKELASKYAALSRITPVPIKETH
jgi:tetratricopeptide (TPR) repeat protein